MKKYLSLTVLICFLSTLHTTPNEDLIQAAKDGSIRRTKYALECGASPDTRTAHRWTPLMFAARDGNRALANILISAGASVNTANKKGWTPLMFAARKNRLPLVKILLHNGAKINKQNKRGKTALIWASKLGHLEIIIFLLEQEGINIDLVDKIGRTALMYASEKGHGEIVRTLIHANANPEISDKNEWTAFSLAIKNKHIHIVSIFISELGLLKQQKIIKQLTDIVAKKKKQQVSE